MAEKPKNNWAAVSAKGNLGLVTYEKKYLLEDDIKGTNHKIVPTDYPCSMGRAMKPNSGQPKESFSGSTQTMDYGKVSCYIIFSLEDAIATKQPELIRLYKESTGIND